MNQERWARTCAIFAEVLQCEPDKREALLRESCAGDPGLRAEVDQLLANDARARREDFLSPRSTAIPNDPGAHPATERPQGHPEGIGRYKVIRLLGEGGFGRVYLAFDDDLEREVAIKVPRRDRIAGPADIDAYLAEARVLARLMHPQIVTIHEFGRTEDGLCYTVSRYIEGGSLAARIARGRFSFVEAAELVAIVAEAAHYAHTQGVVHRDIKPANILLDSSGKPSLADFGLALKDEDFGKGAGLAGTPAYMSPEQARGEGHLVNGSSDIFSLGVVLYELLAGRRPFRGDSPRQTMERIATADPRPPRQVDDTIPRELERICLKALAKRAAERYTTAKDMAEDLRHFLSSASAAASAIAAPPPLVVSPYVTPPPFSPGGSHSDWGSVPIIPKGLRSFDEHDADFFLELLPGPCDREGLPDSIRFWKARIEAVDPDRTFRVGLLYGPSGSGKSSLVKAGLLPRLGKHVLTVYLEATAAETEARLLRGLRRACPELFPNLGLVDSLASLRRGGPTRSGQKVLIVLDQFEQWLFAMRGKENTELASALRQCDGEHVQAILLVRDDFWMAATRFMRDLEVDLVAGRNIAAVDLFDPRHARKVLTAFGRAYGALPEAHSSLTKEQRAFLDQTIAGLARDGKVVSVRLALFAEMIKGKPWTPATLKAVGGTEGVGVTFLEETFGSAQSNPKYRLHQNGAQGVLKALLPETGADIKGRMRSEAELRTASGYARRPREFEDLIGMLDGELRLITPADPDTLALEEQPVQSPGERSFQLTHDYLVHSLREWLTRKQRETPRGRAELRLAERSAEWNAKPEDRLLPSASESIAIRLRTRKDEWTESQRRMMKRAARVYGLRMLGLAAVLAAIVAAGLVIRERVDDANHATHASGLVRQLLNVETAQVPETIRAMQNYRRWSDPELRAVVRTAGEDSKAKLHASLALLPVDSSQAAFLSGRLLTASASELPVLREALRSHQSKRSIARLWTALDSAGPKDRTLLPVAGALALYDPENPRWASVAGKVAEAMVSVNLIFHREWLDDLTPARQWLTTPLSRIFRDKKRPDTERERATSLLAVYAGDQPTFLADLLMDADPPSFADLFPAVRKRESETIPVFQAEIAQKAEYPWNDPPLDPSWTRPSTALASRVEAAQGLLAERFAFCQTLPLDEFKELADGLTERGYRPVRFRPFADGPTIRVAAVWTRDGRSWRHVQDRTAAQVQEVDEDLRKEGFVPVDAAGYLATDPQGKQSDRYAVLWGARRRPDEHAVLDVGTATDSLDTVRERLKLEGLTFRTVQVWLGSDGRTRYCDVQARLPRIDVVWDCVWKQFEGSFDQSQATRADLLLNDLVVSPSEPPRSTRERAQAQLEAADAVLAKKPGDLAARISRARANTHLGHDLEAITDLDLVCQTVLARPAASLVRAPAHARLGHKREALIDLETFTRGPAPESTKLVLAAIVRSELGEGADAAFEALESALAQRADEPGLSYAAAKAHALASRSLHQTDSRRSRIHAKRALSLLETAVQNGHADHRRIQDDPGFDGLRQDPAFARLMEGAGPPDRFYTGVWISDPNFEAERCQDLEPSAHLRRCRELAAQDYRPITISLAQTSPGRPAVSTTVWHRPVISELEKDRLARRQALAAVALVRMGRIAEVSSFWKHGAEPRRRSFLVNLLKPFGAQPHALFAEFSRIHHSVLPAASRSRSFMDTVLFHPETSTRRAIILALGQYSPDELNTEDRGSLTETLLALYDDDPDAGIHSASEWALRQWGQEEKIRTSTANLPREDGGDDRRWYVNCLEQTMVIVAGPVEYRMGSPPSEPDRIPLEISHLEVIPRRFAIAATEVTVGQFQRFLSENPTMRETSTSGMNHTPETPQGAVSWYEAAAFCNWLSRKEGRPECYEPNAQGHYSTGMRIKPGALALRGYRLPTEAEWEYACRAGGLTCRPYGYSIDLIDGYGWTLGNSEGHSGPCGSLQPNDLGLFDTLGNVHEWCQDQHRPYRPRKDGREDVTEHVEIVAEGTSRTLRGGGYLGTAVNARAAARFMYIPSIKSFDTGFRPARTCP